MSRRRIRLGLRQQLLAIGLLGVLMALVIAQSALVGLRQVHRSDRALSLISQAQRAHQDADMMHDALRADVYNALLVSRGFRPGLRSEAESDIQRHIATMRADLRRIDSLNLSGPVGRSLASLRKSLQVYATASEQLLDVALRDPTKAEPALRDFDATFHQLEQEQARVTAQVATAAAQTKARAESASVAAERRILLASFGALGGLLLLTVMLSRMGRNLALLMTRQRGVAETLQHSLLPDRLPDLPGLTFAARYQPGSVGVEVGGDWYDVIALPTGEVGLVMGDVLGHDLRAASVMGQIRNALRAYALEGLSPADAMSRLNQFVRQIGGDEMATCVFAVFHPEASTLLIANAGHLPPMLVGADRSVVLLEEDSCPPVGGLDEATYTERLYHLQPGTTVLLYTDGLIERRTEDIAVGLDRLGRAVAAGPDEVDALCEHLLAQLIDGELTDDVALLALRAESLLGDTLQLTVPALLTELVSLRRTVARWLDEAKATPEEIFELTVACCEAATNAIEHAYGPGMASFDLTAVLTGRWVDITITDHGTWRPARGEDRGRGLSVIRSFTDAATVEHGTTGTTVTMRRRLADVPALELWQGIG